MCPFWKEKKKKKKKPFAASPQEKQNNKQLFAAEPGCIEASGGTERRQRKGGKYDGSGMRHPEEPMGKVLAVL